MMRILTLLGVLAVAMPASANLLVNGDFDQGPDASTPTGWTKWDDGWGNGIDVNEVNDGGWIYNPSPTEYGTYSYRAGEWNNSGGNAGILQVVSGLVPGETYTLDFDVAWGGGANTHWHEIGISDGAVSDGNQGTLANGLWKAENTTEDFWHDVSLTVTAASDTATVFIKTGMSGSGWEPVGTWVDNVVLTPEPTGLLLLGLAGLPLLRRRRA